MYTASSYLKNTVVSIALSFDELNKIDEYCNRFNVSRSELMRDAVKIVLWMREDKPYLDTSKKSEIDEYFDAIEAEKQKAGGAGAPD